MSLYQVTELAFDFIHQENVKSKLKKLTVGKFLVETKIFSALSNFKGFAELFSLVSGHYAQRHYAQGHYAQGHYAQSGHYAQM